MYNTLTNIIVDKVVFANFFFGSETSLMICEELKRYSTGSQQ